MCFSSKKKLLKRPGGDSSQKISKNFKKFFSMEKSSFIHQLMQFLTEITKIIVTFDLIEKILKKF
jgi:hypothetical protein